MKTILIALCLYVAFVACVFVLRFIAWIISEIKKENARIRAKQAAKDNKARVESYTDNTTPDCSAVLIVKEKPVEKPLNRATIAAYEKQKEIIKERIADVEETLDLAPRGNDRDKLQEKRIKLYNDLANIENKIYRVSK